MQVDNVYHTINSVAHSIKENSMTSKTYLITGGTTGIGFAVAKSLREEGHNIIITGQNPQRVSAAASEIGSIGYVADSQDLGQIAKLAADLANDQIKLDGLVLNAGVFFPKPFMELTPDDFDLTMDINTKGPFFTLQKLAPIMNSQSSVVFVSSIAVHKAFPGCSVYAASKAAFEGICRVANLELADKGIRINSVQPGVTATEIQGKAGMSDAEQSEFYETLKATPLGRVMTAQDQVGAIQFLLSDHSLALRNAVIEVAGGQTL